MPTVVIKVVIYNIGLSGKRKRGWRKETCYRHINGTYEKQLQCQWLNINDIHTSTDELRAVIFSGSGYLTIGEKKKTQLALISVCFFTLTFKSLFVFLKDLSYLRMTGTTLQYLTFTTINLSKTWELPSSSIVTDSINRST